MLIIQSVGIIGGADGPTAIFVTGGFPWGLVVLAATAALGLILYKSKRK